MGGREGGRKGGRSRGVEEWRKRHDTQYNWGATNKIGHMRRNKITSKRVLHKEKGHSPNSNSSPLSHRCPFCRVSVSLDGSPSAPAEQRRKRRAGVC